MPKYISEHCLYAPVFQYLSHCPLSHCPIVSLLHYSISLSQCLTATLCQNPIIPLPHCLTAPLFHWPSVSLPQCLTAAPFHSPIVSLPGPTTPFLNAPLSHQSTVPLYTAPLSHCVAVLFLTVITLVFYWYICETKLNFYKKCSFICNNQFPC